MENKDEVVQNLLNIIKKQKSEIETTTNAKWLTNCSYQYKDKDRINLQTVMKVDILIAIYAELKMYEQFMKLSLEELKIDKVIDHLGFPINDWLADVKTRIDKLQISQKKKDLAKLEKRLDLLVSKEMRDELELAAIKKELGL